MEKGTELGKMCVFPLPLASSTHSGSASAANPRPLSVMQRTGFYKDTSAHLLCLREHRAWSELQLAVGRALGSGQYIGRMPGDLVPGSAQPETYWRGRRWGGLKQVTLLLGPQIHHLQRRVFKAVIFQVVFLLYLF